jgi:hypothetical protein
MTGQGAGGSAAIVLFLDQPQSLRLKIAGLLSASRSGVLPGDAGSLLSIALLDVLGRIQTHGAVVLEMLDPRIGIERYGGVVEALGSSHITVMLQGDFIGSLIHRRWISTEDGSHILVFCDLRTPESSLSTRSPGNSQLNLFPAGN